MARPLVLWDAQYALARACWSPKIESDYTPTGIFFNSLWEAKDLGDPVLVFDGKRPQFRLDIYPEYKAKPEKEKTPEKLAEEARFKELLNLNRKSVKELAAHAGLPVLHPQELEADDVVGLLAKAYQGRRDIIAVTSDSDYFQICKYGARVFRPWHGGQTVTALSFYEKEGFPVSHYALFLCMTGTHNAVSGVPGIGPKRAAAIVKELEEPSLSALLSWAESTPGTWSGKVKEHFGIIKRNLRLVDFDYIPTSHTEILDWHVQLSEGCRLDHKSLLIRGRQLGVGNLARWVSHLSKQGRN